MSRTRGTLKTRGMLGRFFGGPRGPVQLTIVYDGANQFDFKWKAPSGSFLIFHEEGATTKTEGADAVLKTHTTSFITAGTYSFWITGDVTDLTYIDIENQSIVSGDVSGWSVLTDLTQLYVDRTGVSGDISSWVALINIIYLYCYTTSVSGDISGFAALPDILSLRCYGTSVTFDNTTAWTNASLNQIWVNSNSWDSTMVNNSITSFSTITTPANFNIAGTNAHRTAASNDDLNTLLANGNTITLNDTLGAELHTSANAASDPNSNEADATTGWIQVGLDAGANIFESQGVVKNVGSYSLQFNSNPTPTLNAKAELHITVETGEVYRGEFDVRHVGSGLSWVLNENGSNFQFIGVGEITFQTVVHYFTTPDTDTFFRFNEANGSNNGGLYVDSFSLKKVTFP